MGGDEKSKVPEQVAEAVKSLKSVSKKFSASQDIFSIPYYYNFYLGLALQQLSESIADDKWLQLFRYAVVQRRYYRQALKDYEDKIAEIAVLNKQFLELKKVKKNLAAVGKSVKWPEIEQTIIKTMTARGAAKKTIETELKRVKAISGQTITKSYQTILDRYHTRAELALGRNLPIHIGGLYAEAVAQFNLRCAIESSKADIAKTAEWSQSNKKTIDSVYSEAKRLLKRKAYTEFRPLIEKIREQCMISLAEGVRYAVVLRNSIADSGAEHQDEAYSLGCATADIIREWLKIYALSYILEIIAANPYSEMAASWTRSAAKIDIPSSDAVAPASLSALRGKKIKDGSPLNVLAKVSDVVIIQHGRNYISFANLEDGKGNCLTAVLPYAKIESVGIDPGCSVCLSGIYRNKIDKYVFDVPEKLSQRVGKFSKDCIVVDRLNLNELKENNWLYWIDLQLRPYFIAVPNGLAASWSWVPGVKGAGNPLQFINWFEGKRKWFVANNHKYNAAEDKALLADEALLFAAIEGNMGRIEKSLAQSLQAHSSLESAIEGLNSTAKIHYGLDGGSGGGAGGGRGGGGPEPPPDPDDDISDWDPDGEPDKPPSPDDPWPPEPKEPPWPEQQPGPDIPPDPPDPPDWDPHGGPKDPDEPNWPDEDLPSEVVNPDEQPGPDIPPDKPDPPDWSSQGGPPEKECKPKKPEK